MTEYRIYSILKVDKGINFIKENKKTYMKGRVMDMPITEQKHWTLDIFLTREELDERLIDLKFDKRQIIEVAHPMENIYTVEYI